MVKTKFQKKKEQLEKRRKEIIKELQKIEKKYGFELFRSACYRKLTVDRQKKQAKAEIKKKEEELERLRKGLPLSQY